MSKTKYEKMNHYQTGLKIFIPDHWVDKVSSKNWCGVCHEYNARIVPAIFNKSKDSNIYMLNENINLMKFLFIITSLNFP